MNGGRGKHVLSCSTLSTLCNKLSTLCNKLRACYTQCLEPTLMSDLEPTLVSCHVMSCLEPSNQGSILSQLQEHNVSEHAIVGFEPTHEKGQDRKTGDAL